jgi:copper oxidase (laccase) domain-containing protein
VHGVDVAVFDQLPEAATKTVADAAILTRPGTAVAFTTADCVPILISSKSAALAIHAGWRSLAGGIIEKAVGMLLEYEIEKTRFEAVGGSSDSNDSSSSDIRASDNALAGLRVWVGPAIDQANYEIDDATSSQLLSRPAIAKNAESCLVQNRPGHWLADLPKMAELIFRDLGIAETHITQSQLSTYNEAILHSARRDGEDSGRMANFIVLLPEY